jgi:hypothetical protein
MDQQDAPPAERKDPFGALANEIETRPTAEIDEAPDTRAARHIYWMIGGLCALTIGVAEIGILLHGDGVGDAPPIPPALEKRLQSDACASRMTVVMDGIMAYKAETGAPPQSLAALYPRYITFQPIDPAVQEPYGYEVRGESITLTCPSAAMSGAAGAPAKPAGASGA